MRLVSRKSCEGITALPGICLVVASMLALTGCVSSSPTPPASLPGIFAGLEGTSDTAAESEQVETAEANPADQSVAPQQSEQLSQPDPALALAENNDTDSPADQAAAAQTSGVPVRRPDTNSNAAPSEPQNDAPLTATDGKALAAAQQVPAPQTSVAPSEPQADVSASSTPQVEPEQSTGGGLFALFKTNNAGRTPRSTSRERSGTTVTTRSTKRRTGPRPTARIPVGTSSNNGSLPGVSLNNLFGIDASEETRDEARDQIRMASVGTMARRGNFGLLLQRPDIQVGCFPPQLVRLLKQVERRFGRTPVVTSGYRSPRKNRRVRGARNSTHVRCLAADIQVVGVSKWQLAKYLRSLPGRGGVGTYCHTKSVHIDIGKKRDWNWRCRRKRSRRS